VNGLYGCGLEPVGARRPQAVLAVGWCCSSSASPSQCTASALKAKRQGKHLHPGRHGLAEQLAVEGIGRIAGGKVGHVAPAEAGHQHGPGGRDQGHQFAEVFLAALGDGVGEQGQFALAPGGVLDLHIDRSGVGRR